MRPASFALIALALTIAAATSAQARSMFRLPAEIGRVEGPRDCNIFQVEPTILHERYYTSGQCERHQYCGNILPEGSPIPDTDFPVKVDVKTSVPAPHQQTPLLQTEGTPINK